MKTVTVTYFKIKKGFGARFWALQQMWAGRFFLRKTPGICFYKILGSGAGEGFGAAPDFSVYCLLAVWEEQKSAETFFQKGKYFLRYKKQCQEYCTWYLLPSVSHGKWEGQNPFGKGLPVEDGEPVAILTRATLRWHRIGVFRRSVPAASNAVTSAPGCVFASGVGEWPLIQQATFSVWQTAAHMKAYAYQHPAHRTAIQKTKEYDWYKEELFARFRLFRQEGTWNGRPLEEILAGPTNQ
jgi:hypothetical protein